MVTVTESEAGSPGRPGFRMVFEETGQFEGTVGGGSLEDSARIMAGEAFTLQRSLCRTFDLSPGGDLGMACGGRTTLFAEYHGAGRCAHLFGAGHICRDLAPILDSLGYRVEVYDDRPGFADPSAIPSAGGFHTVDFAGYIDSFMPRPDDIAVIFTHDHHADAVILESFLSRDLSLCYVGMIGSRGKVDTLCRTLREKFPDAALWQRFHAPIGLNIGTKTPGEISVSIAAEILAVTNKVKRIDFLKNKPDHPK